jgi:hypothetical protein
MGEWSPVGKIILVISCVTAMAAAGGNGPLMPHMRACAPLQRIKWMGDNPLSKWIYFF